MLFNLQCAIFFRSLPSGPSPSARVLIYLTTLSTVCQHLFFKSFSNSIDALALFCVNRPPRGAASRGSLVILPYLPSPCQYLSSPFFSSFSTFFPYPRSVRTCSVILPIPSAYYTTVFTGANLSLDTKKPPVFTGGFQQFLSGKTFSLHALLQTSCGALRWGFHSVLSYGARKARPTLRRNA